MKVLWFANVVISDKKISNTGTWIQPIIDLILKSKQIELYVIAPSNVQGIIRKDCLGVKQWLVDSRYKKNSNGLPKNNYLKKISQLVTHISPDIIHVWGTENFWGTLFTNEYIKNIPMLLEMQGLKGECGKLFTADLTLKEQIKCIGFKELITRRNIFTIKSGYENWGLIENEIIKRADIINVQSDWMENQVVAKHSKALINRVCLPLRDEFYETTAWTYEENKNKQLHSIFIISSGPIPYKGLHVAIRALALIKAFIPDVRLKIAGNFVFNGLRKDGYATWLRELAINLDVWDDIDWLGSLNASNIIKEMKNSSVNLVCSFIESYCLALAEGMYLGIPCVSSYNGGTSYVGKDSSVLFYPPGDAVDCAMKVVSILEDDQYARNLSHKLRIESKCKHDLTVISKNLLLTYSKLNKKLYF
jgi:glycosyltransferase involved in cell wall biosynthesis